MNIKVIFADGNSLTTKFNGTFKQAQDYYIGNRFTFGGSDSEGNWTEKSVVAVIVELTFEVFSELMLTQGYIDCYRVGNDEIQLRYENGKGLENQGFAVTHYDNTVRKSRKVFEHYNDAVRRFKRLAEKIS